MDEVAKKVKQKSRNRISKLLKERKTENLSKRLIHAVVSA